MNKLYGQTFLLMCKFLLFYFNSCEFNRIFLSLFDFCNSLEYVHTCRISKGGITPRKQALWEACFTKRCAPGQIVFWRQFPCRTLFHDTHQQPWSMNCSVWAGCGPVLWRELIYAQPAPTKGAPSGFSGIFFRADQLIAQMGHCYCQTLRNIWTSTCFCSLDGKLQNFGIHPAGSKNLQWLKMGGLTFNEQWSQRPGELYLTIEAGSWALSHAA